MVKRQLVSYTYTCDVCGGTIDDGDSATRQVSWEGTAYVVDLCTSHSSELGELLTNLKSFVDAGNRVTGRRGRRPAAVTASAAKAPRGRRSSASGSTPKRGDLSAVRAWARESGRQVSERGRIPGDLLAAYEAANSASAPAAPAAPPSAPAAEAPSEPSPTPVAAAAKKPRARKAAAASSKATSAPKRGDLSAVRAWARENGRHVSERGRIPAELLSAYDAANNGSTPAPAPAARKRRPRKAAAAVS